MMATERMADTRLYLSTAYPFLALLLLILAVRIKTNSELVDAHLALVLLNLITLAASLVSKTERAVDLATFPFHLYRLPLLVVYGGLIFYIFDCVSQMESITRLSYLGFINGDLMMATTLWKLAILMVGLLHAALLITHYSALRFIDDLAASRKLWLGSRACVVFFALPLLTTLSVLWELLSVLDLAFLTRLAAFSLNALFVTVCVPVVMTLTSLFAHQSAWKSSTRTKSELTEALAIIKELEGVTSILHQAWWTVHGSNSILLLQLEVNAESNPAIVTRMAREVVVPRVATRAFIECVRAPTVKKDDNSAEGDGDEPLGEAVKEVYFPKSYSEAS